MKIFYKFTLCGLFMLATNQIAAAATLGNVNLAALWLSNGNVNHTEKNETVFRRFIQPRQSFGCSKSEFRICKGQELVFVETKNVFCAIYRKDDRALIVVSNQQAKTLHNIVNLNLGKIFTRQSTGFLYKLKAFNAENGKMLEMELIPAEADCYAEISVEIPANDFCLIELKMDAGQ